MPCLEPDKNISEEAKRIVNTLGNAAGLEKQAIAKESGFNLPLVSRKLRELIEKELILENEGKYSLTNKGKEALEVLNKQREF